MLKKLRARTKKHIKERLKAPISEAIAEAEAAAERWAWNAGKAAWKTTKRVIPKTFRTSTSEPLLLEMPHGKKRSFSDMSHRSKSARPKAKRGRPWGGTKASHITPISVRHYVQPKPGNVLRFYNYTSRGLNRGSRRRFKRRRGISKSFLRQARMFQAMQSPPLIYRVIGDAQMQVGPDNRSLYQGRVMNWAYQDATSGTTGPYIDFGNKWVYDPAQRGRTGILSNLRLQSVTSAASGNSDRLETYAGLLNQFNPSTDMNRKIHLTKATAQYHWKNNSPVSTNMHFYVFRALQDIPADAFDEKTETLTSAYSPAEMFLRGCSGSSTVGYADKAVGDVLASLMLYPSDAKKLMRKHWKLVDHRNYELMPGDEAKVNIRQKPRVIDLIENFDAFRKFPTYGLWARKGDLVTMTILRGGLGDGSTAGLTAAAGYMGVDGSNYIDLIVRKEFKARLLPIGFTAAQIRVVNELPIIASGFNQWQPAINQG